MVHKSIGHNRYVLSLRHIDHSTALYSNEISANPVLGYDIVLSADRSKVLVNIPINGRNRLGIISIDLDAETDQRLSLELLPEPVRSEWSGSCAISPNNRYLACPQSDPPAINIYNFGDHSQRTVALSAQTLGVDQPLDSLGFLNNGLILADLNGAKSMVVDPVNGAVVRAFYSSTNAPYPI